MKFNLIKGNLSERIVKQAQEKLTALALDLSVREDNSHVGSGLGGNNFQMFTMIGMQHLLSNKNISIEIKDSSFVWGSEFLINNSLVNIRAALDKAFLKISDYDKLMSLTFLNVSNINGTYSAYEENFPILKDIFYGKQAADFKKIPPQQQIIIAFIICAKYSFELDNDVVSNTATVGESLSTFTPEVILLAVRKYIGINRIVKFNLDEHKSWDHMFARVNNSIKAYE